MVVAGRSKNVGMPIAMLLHTDGAHERPGGKTVELEECSLLPFVRTFRGCPMFVKLCICIYCDFVSRYLAYLGNDLGRTS